MTEAPKRIWAWPDKGNPESVTGRWSCNTYSSDLTQSYILAAEHERLMAERDAEITRLRKALLDATAHLIAAAASYRTYARRGGDIRPRAEVDAFFTTRARDYDRAAERARAALGDDNG